jgi:hypothetical protein
LEEVRDIDDQSLSVLNWPNARKLPEMAAAYLSGQDGAAKDAELAEMRERMRAMEDMLEEQMAQPKLTKDGKVDGRTKAARGPGKTPRKWQGQSLRSGATSCFSAN